MEASIEKASYGSLKYKTSIDEFKARKNMKRKENELIKVKMKPLFLQRLKSCRCEEKQVKLESPI